MKTTVSAAALLAALMIAGPAAAQDATGSIGDYGSLDANADTRLSQDEFRPFVDQTYDAWDTNSDDLLDEDEFHSGVFGYWDEDRNTILTQDEYERGYASWFNDLEPRDQAFGVGEGMSEQDFVSSARGRDLFPDWSIGEEGLDRETFSEGLYGTFRGSEDEIGETRFREMTGENAPG